jgi:valyl-tRNA synthetase
MFTKLYTSPRKTWIKKHKLPEKIIINKYGKLENTCLDILDGLKVTAAREAIIPLLEEK